MSFPTSHTSVESSSSSYSPQPCRQFTFSEIKLATRNFNESLVIGRGGFGKVYRGTITCGEILLNAAIKRLESTSNQGAVEFWAEVEMLSELRHSQLVSLIGYCSDGQEMILVYEYMSNGTLADHLHKRRASLTWVRRLKICIGAAHGLDYLHSDTCTKPRVAHRDVKSSNILLSSNWVAKVSDFGLSKIVPANQSSSYVNTLVRGTFGYLDPDYFQTGRLTRKSDVYAFGVVLLEVLCGKKAVDRSIDEEHWGLATWAQDSIKEGRLKQIVDSNLRGIIYPKCLKQFALLADRCLHSHPKQRPTMVEVVVCLELILALQEKADRTVLLKRFGIRVPKCLSPSNQESSVGGISLKSMDLYLYTVVGKDRIVHQFDFGTIVYATENFSEANMLTHVGYFSMSKDMSLNPYYSMYKGRLPNGRNITIAEYSYTRYEECMNEASILVTLEHENVIQLLGYCTDETKLYLIFDFAPSATLNGLLFDPTCNLLDWHKRYKIILGVARALVYLHNHAPIRTKHRVVTSKNILLDESFEPKLSGFAFATTITEPDCNPTTKADVLNFGVLLLGTVTGQRKFDPKQKATKHDVMLIDYVQTNWLEGTSSNVIDPRIDVDSILITKFVEIGLLCVQTDAVLRPTMEEVVDMLHDTSSLTLPVSEMRARMNGGITSLDCIMYEDSDTGEVEDFVSELCPR